LQQIALKCCIITKFTIIIVIAKNCTAAKFPPQLGVEACAGPFQVAKTREDGYVLPRTRHPMTMMMMMKKLQQHWTILWC